MLIRALISAAIMSTAPAPAQTQNTNWLNYREGNFIITDLKISQRRDALNCAERNAAGEIINGVLLLQGNTGTGANWLRPTLAGRAG